MAFFQPAAEDSNPEIPRPFPHDDRPLPAVGDHQQQVAVALPPYRAHFSTSGRSTAARALIFCSALAWIKRTIHSPSMSAPPRISSRYVLHCSSFSRPSTSCRASRSSERGRQPAPLFKPDLYHHQCEPLRPPPFGFVSMHVPSTSSW